MTGTHHAARDWVVVWRAMLSLASFLVSHSVELRSFNADKLDALISQVRRLARPLLLVPLASLGFP